MRKTSDNPAAYISEKWKDIYQKLCRGEGSLFNHMTGLFTLCASIGYLNDQKSPLEKRKDIFKWTSLNPDTEIPVLTAIAWGAKERDLSLLSDRKIILKNAGEFDEAGMAYLHEQFFEDYWQEGPLIPPDKSDLAFHLAQSIEELRRNQSVI